MALIAMTVYDTDGEGGNSRTWMTEKTLQSLSETVDWSKHRLVVVDNASCQKSKDLLTRIQVTGLCGKMSIMTNKVNVGTARGINQAWLMRLPGQNAVKMDNDLVIHESGWLDRLEECIAREPRIGVVALKRTDLAQWPIQQGGQDYKEHVGYKSKLIALPHKYRSAEPWLVVERVGDTIGTCQLYSSALLDKIGFLYQMNALYAFDDGLAAIRAHVAGFWSVFYPHIGITHIDPGNSEFTTWKQKYAGEMMDKFHQVKDEYLTGKRPVWQGPEDA